jgi:hypothetical protein
MEHSRIQCLTEKCVALPMEAAFCLVDTARGSSASSDSFFMRRALQDNVKLASHCHMIPDVFVSWSQGDVQAIRDAVQLAGDLFAASVPAAPAVEPDAAGQADAPGAGQRPSTPWSLQQLGGKLNLLGLNTTALQEAARSFHLDKSLQESGAVSSVELDVHGSRVGALVRGTFGESSFRVQITMEPNKGEACELQPCSCSCTDWLGRRCYCKHMAAALLSLAAGVHESHALALHAERVMFELCKAKDLKFAVCRLDAITDKERNRDGRGLSCQSVVAAEEDKALTREMSDDEEARHDDKCDNRTAANNHHAHGISYLPTPQGARGVGRRGG